MGIGSSAASQTVTQTSPAPVLSQEALQASPVFKAIGQVIASGKDAQMPASVYLTPTGATVYVDVGYTAVLGDAAGNLIKTITRESGSGQPLPAGAVPTYVFLVTSPKYPGTPMGTVAPTSLIPA